jgi:polysaccharide biosynthesis/export protein VpsN
MTRTSLFRALFALLSLLSIHAYQSASAGSDAMQGYRLSAGDKVRIAVFGEDDLTVTERVSAKGTVAYPLIGELSVGGLTPGQLEELVASRLRGPYLVDPRVSVSIEEYRQFFVMGQVNKPGSYAYQPGLTVRKAISIAGGFTERASRSKIFLVSEAGSGQERRVAEEDQMGPGDTIVVKESFF